MLPSTTSFSKTTSCWWVWITPFYRDVFKTLSKIFLQIYLMTEKLFWCLNYWSHLKCFIGFLIHLYFAFVSLEPFWNFRSTASHWLLVIWSFSGSFKKTFTDRVQNYHAECTTLHKLDSPNSLRTFYWEFQWILKTAFFHYTPE